uniref:Uncharacterized protein n=1 Tax=Aegilops tauschii subsp. strangulata TaxID=200361 RepID=A0A453H4W2_AEGTS
MDVHVVIFLMYYYIYTGRWGVCKFFGIPKYRSLNPWSYQEISNINQFRDKC